MHHYEIEIKSLLKNSDHADQLLLNMKRKDPEFVHLGTHKELNHYFVGGNLTTLAEKVAPYLDEAKKNYLAKLVRDMVDFSLRTRWVDEKVILVVKASVDDTTSSNGIARLEFETVLKNMTLAQLDQVVLSAGFEYQAKWSRERQAVKYRNLDVSIDKNAGYGYLAEFETIVSDLTRVEDAKKYIRQIMEELAVEELEQERLARMFEHYNQNWDKYYGTDKTFLIE
jgi:predicted adenylyl cyclase CyaB